MSFTDTDLTGGEISGVLAITPAADESDITHYVVYWGSDESTKASATAIATLAKNGGQIDYEFAANTPIQNNATHLLVYTSNADGEINATDLIAAVAIEDKGLPENTAQSLAFTDTDNDEDEIGGILSITVASDESEITDYVIYWGSDASTKFSATPIDTVAVTGSDIDYPIAANTILPAGASHFLVFSKNDDGEMVTGVSVAIVDSALPDYITITDNGNGTFTATYQPGPDDGNDSQTRNGAEADAFYGNTSTLEAGNQIISAGGHAIQSFLSFDLSFLPSNISVSSAYLELTYASRSGSASVILRKVDSSFNESTINANNKPSMSTFFGSALSTSGRARGNKLLFGNGDAQLMTYVEEQALSRESLWLGIYQSIGNSWNSVSFYSSEWATASERPKLVITFSAE